MVSICTTCLEADQGLRGARVIHYITTKRPGIVCATAAILVVSAVCPCQAADPSDPVECRRAIAKETSKFINGRVKALQNCENRKLKRKLPFTTSCGTDEKTATGLAKADSKLRVKIAKACGGANKVCGDADDNLDMQADLGFPAACPNFADRAHPDCTRAVESCGDLAGCLACIGGGVADLPVALAYAAFVETDPKAESKAERALNKCQRAIGREATKFVLAKDKALQKCWDKLFDGKPIGSNVCPDPAGTPGFPAAKAAEQIAKAESKSIAKICKACGGADKACDAPVAGVNPGTPAAGGSAGGDDLTPAAIGFPERCTAATVPLGGPSCDAAVGSLADLVYCVNCVSEFAVDCGDRARVPDGPPSSAPVPLGCNPGGLCPPPATPALDPFATLTHDDRITISGAAEADSNVTVTTPNGSFDLVASGGRFAVEVPLAPNRVNQITFVATAACGSVSSPAVATVTQDGEPPTLFIDFPGDGAELSTPTTSVAGRVADLLSGFMGLTVNVNGVPAIVDVGVGTNGTFVAPDVQLAEGVPTQIEASAVDAVGNTTTKTITVTRLAPQAGVRTAVVESGDGQTQPVGALLPAPVVVRVREGDGSPAAGVPVSFRVTRSDGRLTPAGSGKGSLTLGVATDPAGLARAFWRLGSDAGCGNNRLEVTAAGVAAPVFFSASANAGPAAQVSIGMGNHQRAETGTVAPAPLRAWVHDGRNPVANVPLTFTVIEGGGLVEGAAEATVNTDQTGHAEVGLTLGPNAGRNAVRATFSGNPGQPAVFVAFGVARNGLQPTRLAGRVLDNASRPIQGAECMLIAGTATRHTTSDLNGEFLFDQLSAAGPAKLFVDGLTAFHVGGAGGEDVPPGSFPGLEFDLILVPNAGNTLMAPVLLPALNPSNARLYDGTQDVELTVEGIDGLRMTVRAGSMRRHDGSMPTPEDPAIIALNQVNFDDIPMPMPDGASPPFAWTLQPAGATFDPPIAIDFPNIAALPAGAAMYFLSFNHETGRFEIVATGQVTADGASMVSDPGSGVTVAGWGGFCPPYPNTGTVEGTIVDRFESGGADATDDPACPNNECKDGETVDTPSASERGSGPIEQAKDGEMSEDPAHEGFRWLRFLTRKDGDQRSSGGDPIILGTGEFIHTEVDLSIPGRGFPFEVRRTYRSQYNLNGPFGFNWDFTYNERLFPPDPNEPDQSMLRCSGRSRVDRYVHNPDGSFTSPDGFYDTLRANPDGTFTIRNRYGLKKTFDPAGRLASIVDRNGNTMTFAYDADERLRTVTDTLGRDITFSFNDRGRISTITDFMGRQLRYGYDAEGNLVAARSPIVVGTSTGNDFPEGKTTSYEYTSGFDAAADPRLAFLNHNLVAIADPKGQRYLVNTYGEDPDSYTFDRVVAQQFGEVDQTFTYEYAELNAGVAPSADLPRNQTVEVDRNGNRRVYVHNEVGNLLEERVETNRSVNPDDPPVFVTTHAYNADGERVSTTFPEGNQTELTYDDGSPDRLQQGNLIAVRQVPGPRSGDQAEIRVTMQYEPVYNRLRAEIGPRGTDATFVPQNGGATSTARYMTTHVFDYQEGDNLSALAAELGRPEAEVSPLLVAAGMSLNLGDVNGDGVTDQVSGNVVQRDAPTVQLLPGSQQAGIEGDTTQEIVTSYVYNPFGQMTAEVDPEGNVDDYLYHPENDPDGDGIITVSNRSLAGDNGGYRSAAIRDSRSSPRRRSTAPLTQIRNTWLYDPVGNVIRTIDGRGNPTSYELNALNQVVRQTLEPPLNYQHAYVYDANDNLVREEIQNVDTNGPDLDNSVTYTYGYDVLDNRVTKTEEVSTGEILTTRYEYDRNENVTRVIQPEGNVVDRVYDERDLVFSVTRGADSPDASTSTLTYDGNRNLVRAVDAADNNGDGSNEATRTFYDGYDRVVRTVDAVGNEVRYAYDPANNLVRERRLGTNGGPSPGDDSGAGNVLLAEREMRFDELSREFQRDDLLFANVATVGPEGPLTPADGKVTTRSEYDRNSRRTRLLDDNVHQRVLEYDGVDRVVREVDELDNAVAHAYDANHNLLTTTETERSPEGLVPDETFVTRRQYDTLDRLTVLVDNLGNRTAYAYDSRNNVTRKTDRLGNTTTYVYDGINRRLAEIKDLRTGGTGAGSLDTSNPANSDGQIARLSDWDGNTRLVAETDDNGNVTTYGYDALDRRTLETFADATTNTYVYDRDDNVVSMTDENGSVHTNSYDGINRLVAKDVARAPGVEGTTAWRFEYDGLSRRTRATDDNDPATPDDDSVVELQYDSLSRLLIEIQNGHRVETVFDGVGNRLSCTYPDGRVVETSYDALDRIDVIADQGAVTPIAEYDYIGPGRTLERRYGNGTRLTYHDGAGQDVGYDGIKRVIQHRHERTDGSLVAGFTYAYDREDNRRFEHDLFTDTADVYEYDSAYRLTRAGLGVVSASIAGVANNATTNADVTGLTGSSENTYALDGIGNWVERVAAGDSTIFAANEMNEYTAVATVAQAHDDNGNLTDDGSQQYAYDFANRLVRVTDAGAGEIARYTYDALGRRVGKALATESIAFLYDGARCVEERDGADAVLRQYVHGRAIDEQLEMRTPGSSFLYHDNSLGSVVALSDQTHDVVERYRYDPYGEATIFDGAGTSTHATSAVGSPYQFTGRRQDSESEFLYYRARHYAPLRGRFVQRDPHGTKDGLNLYAYVGSNPANRVDPLGTEKRPASATPEEDGDIRRALLEEMGKPGAYELTDALSKAIGEALWNRRVPLERWREIGLAASKVLGVEDLAAFADYASSVAALELMTTGQTSMDTWHELGMRAARAFPFSEKLRLGSVAEVLDSLTREIPRRYYSGKLEKELAQAHALLEARKAQDRSRRPSAAPVPSVGANEPGRPVDLGRIVVHQDSRF